MGDLGSIFKTMFGNAGNPNAQGLANAGYKQFDPSVTQINSAAYGPTALTNAQQTQIGPGANTFLGGQQNLVAALQAQAQGSGPNLAADQLRQATQNNLASQLAMAAGQRGNQNPGAERMALANQGAAANQAAAGQAASERGRQQLGAEAQLGGALGQYGGQQIGLAENQAGLNQQVNLTNANAANNMSQFNTQSQQALQNAQQQQSDFINNVRAQQQSNENAAIAGQQLSSQNAGQAAAAGLAGAGLNAAGNALGTATKGGSSSNSDNSNSNSTGVELGSDANNQQAADMGVPAADNSGGGSGRARGGIEHGAQHLVGEAGPEAIVKVPAHIAIAMHNLHKAMSEGGVVPSTAAADHVFFKTRNMPRPPMRGLDQNVAGSADNEAMMANRQSSVMPAMDLRQPTQMPTMNLAQPMLAQAQAPQAPVAMAAGGVIPATHVHIHPGQIVDHPEVGPVGDKKSATAVVPLHADGSPKTEAMNSQVVGLLDHPEFRKALAKVLEDNHDTLAKALGAKNA
jgi:hypothetical protein